MQPPGLNIETPTIVAFGIEHVPFFYESPTQIHIELQVTLFPPTC